MLDAPHHPPRVTATARRARTAVVLVAGAALLLASLAAGVALGQSPLGVRTALEMLWAALTGGFVPAADAGAYAIVWELRLPRALLAAVVGAGLATVGVAVQAFVRNPLADPFVLGVSHGAAVGAVAVVLFGGFTALGVYAMSGGAVATALVATALVYLVATRRGRMTPLRLVLVGSVLGHGFAAVTTTLVFLSPTGDAARSVLFWLLGSLAGASWASLPPAAVVVALGLVLLYVRARALNAITLGDDSATALGVEPHRLRRELFVLCALLVGAMVAVSGAVGFVGLVLPHLTRLLVGADHRRVLLVAPVLGAAFLVWVDVSARVLAAPRELPLGVLTAAIGVPVFLLLMRRGHLGAVS